MSAAQPRSAPVPRGESADGDFAAALSALRVAAGAPSFGEITRRVALLREQRSSGHAPGRVTVYDCFRAGRRRVDAELVRDIVLVLGGDEAAADSWRRRAQALSGARSADRVAVTVQRSRSPDREAAAGAGPPVAGLELITGLPGAGKSWRAAHRVDGLLGSGRAELAVTVDLRGYDAALPPVDAGEALYRIAVTLDPGSARSEGPAGWRRRITEIGRAHPLVVVVENATSLDQARPLLALARVVTMLLISRSAFEGAEEALPSLAVRRTPVEPLPVAEAEAVILRELGEGAEDAEAVCRLAEVTGGIRLDLALALDIVRERPGWRLSDTVHLLEQQPRDERIRPALLSLYATLDPAAARLLRLLGLLPGRIDAAVLDEVTARQLLVLQGTHLVERHSDGTVGMHDTVRAFARGRSLAEDPFSGRAAFARELAARLLVSELPARLGESDASSVFAVAQLVREHGLAAESVDLALRWCDPLGNSGWAREALAIARLARSASTGEHRIALQYAIARSLEFLGRFDEALTELHRIERLHEPLPGRLWNVVGNLQRWRGDFEAARDAYRAAIAEAQGNGNLVTEGRAIANLGDIDRLAGSFESAVELYERALTTARTAGDELLPGIVLSNLVLALGGAGRVETALDLCRALLDAPPVGVMAARLRSAAAELMLRLGEVEGAATVLGEPENTEDGTITAFETTMPAARIAIAQGRLAEAAELVETARDQARITESPLMEVDALQLAAEHAVAAGEAAAASALFEAAESLARRIGDRLALLKALEGRGALEDIGDRNAEEAERLREEFAAAGAALEAHPLVRDRSGYWNGPGSSS